MKKAAAYLRVSDERQDEFSPDSQLKLIKDFCSRNDIELSEEHIFFDDGISAKSAKKRQQFNEMIALAKQKEKPFQIILVWKFSRFARNQEESIVYKAMLRKNGVEVMSVSEPIADNPFGGLIERIIEWMDEYYLIRLSDEVKRGMTERAMRGLPNAAPPFGYRMIEGRYVINEEEAAVVRDIFHMYINGEKRKRISDHFRVLGVKNRYGNPLDDRGIEYILNNPCYIGYVRWNPHGRSSSARIYNNAEDILKKADHEPIVSEEIFKKAQEMTALRKNLYPAYVRNVPDSAVFMLKGIVKCHACGSTLVYQKATDGVQCCKYARGVCGVSHYIKLQSLNDMVLHELKNTVQAISFPICIKKAETASPPIHYDALLAAEKNKLERAKEAYREGIDSLREYQAAKEKIESAIELLQKEKMRAAQKSNLSSLNNGKKFSADILELLECESISEELKNLILRTILREIIFFKPDRHIELHFYN